MSDLLKGFVASATLLLFALPAQARSVTDAYGETVDVPDQPQRVVALSELDLDAMLALGKTPVCRYSSSTKSGESIRPYRPWLPTNSAGRCGSTLSAPNNRGAK